MKYKTWGKAKKDRSVTAKILLVAKDGRDVKLRDSLQWSEAQTILDYLAVCESIIIKPEMNAEEFQRLEEYNGKKFLKVFYPEWYAEQEK